MKERRPWARLRKSGIANTAPEIITRIWALRGISDQTLNEITLQTWCEAREMVAMEPCGQIGKQPSNSTPIQQREQIASCNTHRSEEQRVHNRELNFLNSICPTTKYILRNHKQMQLSENVLQNQSRKTMILMWSMSQKIIRSISTPTCNHSRKEQKWTFHMSNP